MKAEPGPRPQGDGLRSVFRSFLTSEASGGLVLMAAAALALVLANSPAAPAYFAVLQAPLFGETLLHWVDDGLMSLFFLLVGLEIKRELLDGQLRTWPDRILPGLAAAGGMLVPALVYLALNVRSPDTLRGWAIPSATDIAFSLGVLSLLGSRVPVSLKVFLTALAILDDLGSVLIIALFYGSDFSPPMLAASAAALAVLIAMNRLHVNRLWPYLVVGAGLWFFVLRSGLHPTLAGVALAFTVPLKPSPGTPEAVDCPLIRLEHGLQPWVAFLVVPLFGFANAGLALAKLDPAMLLTPVPLGVLLGLFVGKQLGVFAFGWAAIRMGWADLPARANWAQFYGVALLCGVGFTMSLFIGVLAFEGSEWLQNEVKIGVLAGSLLSALTGASSWCWRGGRVPLPPLRSGGGGPEGVGGGRVESGWTPPHPAGSCPASQGSKALAYRYVVASRLAAGASGRSGRS